MSQDFPITFGRYELLERLAVGGMAELFRARVRGAEGFEKTVVIKRLLPHMQTDPHFNAMFIDEAKLTAKLVHPKIAQTYELGRHEGQLYIAMELVDGIDGLGLLRESAYRGERVAQPVAVYIIQAVLDALDFAHNQTDDDGKAMAIIHRDVSPSNVLLSRRGDVKLVDFGIARAVEDEHRTKAGTLKGKYGYMSPEQVLGEGLDARSDVFAAGIVLSEMLTGRRLFAAANELDVLLMVRDAKLDRLRRFGADIEPGLMAVLRRALHKERDERFASAAAFREALDEWMFDQRARIGPRDIAELVARYYDDANERRRKHVASAGEVITSVHESDEIEGIPAGDLKIADSMPVVWVEDDEEQSAPVDVSEEPPPAPSRDDDQAPGAVGRALDLQLAEAAAARRRVGEQSGPWPTLDLEELGSEEPSDAVPQAPVEDVQNQSVRYPSIEEAVASVSLREPDPSARDFDDSEVAPEAPHSRSTKRRLPTVEELASTPPPEPPSLDEIGDAPESRGELSDDAPIRVLYTLMAAKAKGLAVFELSGIRKEVYVVDGVPTYVTSNLARELFGEYLVAEGVVSSGELSMALAMMPHYGGKLGDTLVGLGLLKPLEVFRMLTRQVRTKLIDVCTWSKGTYSWYPGRENPREAFPLDLEPWEVLGAGAMALPDETISSWVESRVQDKPRSRRNRAVQPLDFQLSGQVRPHYDAMDGTKTVAELSARFETPEDRLWFGKLLYLFAQTDLVSFE